MSEIISPMLWCFLSWNSNRGSNEQPNTCVCVCVWSCSRSSEIIYLLNCLRKIAMFIPRLASRMETWVCERERESIWGQSPGGNCHTHFTPSPMPSTNSSTRSPASKTHLLFGLSKWAAGFPSPGGRCQGFWLTVMLAEQLFDSLSVNLVFLLHLALSP